MFDATKPDGVWDPSGLVKGWAAERAARRLAAVPDLDWCLNAGGDVVVLCPSGEPFTVGIEDPRDPGLVVAALPCAGGAVATSGTAARGAHLYNPRTGAAAATRWLPVSVGGPSLETADVLATRRTSPATTGRRSSQLCPGTTVWVSTPTARCT